MVGKKKYFWNKKMSFETNDRLITHWMKNNVSPLASYISLLEFRNQNGKSIDTENILRLREFMNRVLDGIETFNQASLQKH
jgi:hypothetical protein